MSGPVKGKIGAQSSRFLLGFDAAFPRRLDEGDSGPIIVWPRMAGIADFRLPIDRRGGCHITFSIDPPRRGNQSVG
jgi:hypothetical protein